MSHIDFRLRFLPSVPAKTVVVRAFGLNVLGVAASTTLGLSSSGVTMNVTAPSVTLTIGAYSTYAADHETWIVNSQNTIGLLAAVLIRSSAGDFDDFWLYPGQELHVFRIGNKMYAPNPGRWRHYDGVAFFVSPTGSDLADGLSPARPLRLVDTAKNRISFDVDCNGVGPTISLANGDYSEVAVAFTYPIVGYHVGYMVGNAASPGSVRWTVGAGQNCTTVRDFCAQIFRGIAFASTGAGSTLISISQDGIGDIWDCYFGAAGSGIHLESTNGGSLGYVVGSILNKVTGSMAYHWYVAAGSRFICTGVIIDLPFALVFDTWLFSTAVACATLAGVTFTGTGADTGSVGRKYIAAMNGVILGIGTVNLPGVDAGIELTGGRAV